MSLHISMYHDVLNTQYFVLLSKKDGRHIGLFIIYLRSTMCQIIVLPFPLYRAIYSYILYPVEREGLPQCTISEKQLGQFS